MRQPDIEMYLKDSDRAAISQWLQSVFGEPCDWQEKGRVSRCLCANIPVVWFEKAVGKWHSLLLESDNTPWQDDSQAAQAAACFLQTKVRCAPGSWQEADGITDADRWLEISPDGSIETLTWHAS